jgi:hypothetical protein
MIISLSTIKIKVVKDWDLVNSMYDIQLLRLLKYFPLLFKKKIGPNPNLRASG